MEALRSQRPAASPSDITIPAKDGWPLGATLYPAEGPWVLTIHSAAATPRTYYRAFAEYLATQGVAVVTYDYRGVGGSRPAGPLRNVSATMRNWADLDAAAILDWALAKFPGRKLLVVGHSFGGQCLGLLPSASRIERVALVASQIGYWGGLAPKDRFPAWFAMHLLLPTLSHLLGYFPGSKVGLGEDLPKGVALEWARWCRSRHYLFDHLTAEERAGYNRFNAPMLAYKITDDTFASGDLVDRLLAYYPQSHPLMRTVAPAELGVRSIGHFGVFRSAYRDTLWAELYQWLVEGRAPASARPVT